ncbi:chromosome partitioning protein, ParB family [Bradyrhizobium brasilense]|uniref:Chromosome partitioning protein, ParB family n=1 Tax=Bradyrhizobium brasilense TaxID=1419277 RepID=A0A1G6IM50_9BRAD|nr:ParB/RepB/Spo0J family partition protein [Bradyrhizobium brasilense]SDC07642.1 chromosome partitioning protein, ParB family [Bradyrhizobium brasilense]
MDLQIPLNKLKFGHEDGEGINARIAGRDARIAELAANLHAQGQIENLIVKDAGDGFYSVANGNRRLAAFRMIWGKDSEQLVNCTLHNVDGAKAFEFSLVTAITAEQLHPVDQYEAFAKLEARGKTNDEIAQQYGMGEKQVKQALALGRLSPVIRDAWRAGEIKAEVAQAFTLAADHKSQDRLYKKLSKENDLDRHHIRAELGVKGHEDVGSLVNFVGIEAYRLRGGAVTEDLFKEQHIVSDDVLLKAMVGERLAKECDRLVVEQGWQWAAVEEDLPKSWRSWPTTRVDVSKFFTEQEAAEAKRLHKLEEDLENEPGYDWDAIQRVSSELGRLEAAVLPRAFTDKQKAKLGCMVAVDDDGGLEIQYGISRPPATTKSEAAARPPTAGESPEIKASSKSGKPAEPDLSQALIQRLSTQLTSAAHTALNQDQDLAISVLLAGLASSAPDGIRVNVTGMGAGKLDLLGARKFADALELARALKPAERIGLLVLVAGAALDFQRYSSNDDNLLKGNPGLICEAIKPDAMNAALRGAFDAKDYFNSVPKALCLAAIKEAIGADIARQQEKKKGPEIAAFALANVPSTGWLPPQLRIKGYDGPPAKPKAAAAAKPQITAAAVRKAKAERETKRAANAQKRVAKAAAKRAPKKKR